MDRWVGLLVVVVLHAAVLWGLWSHRLIPPPHAAATLFVNFIAPPQPAKAAAPKPLPPPTRVMVRQVDRPKPRTLAVETQAIAPAEVIAPPPSPRPAAHGEAAPMPLPPGPLAMSSELSVSCPERPAPHYPGQSRRVGESGLVVLRVELSESGHVASARVTTSSGHLRLDEAALAAVRIWRCVPATRNGQPVRAVAVQPFNFILPGS
ncbi:energy transducer TonB [Accumulibacter sp.]|jgi:protein TonB|uniref:energy transducer TonB n=1 Tax=Accumulibacter sp. TaxID=2053492 RepID=UPI003315BAB2